MIQSRRLNFVNPSTSSYCPSNMLFLGNCNSAFQGQRSSMFNMEETTKKRPFFSSPEDYFDDEYYDEQLPEKKRRLTPEQVDLLEKSFEEDNKLEPERKSQLAKKLRLQPRQVAVWFQNRRARWKTKQLEMDYDLLKASYDSLLSDFDKIVKENEKLKSEAASLSEMLQAKEATGATVRAHESEGLPKATADSSAFQLNVKAEDRLSSGTAGSAVVDEDSPQLLDSGNSFFQSDDYAGCVIPADGIQPEEDGGSDDGRGYFSDVFVTAGQQQHEVEESLPWWMWY